MEGYPLLAGRTTAASPTKLGKEIYVFVERLRNQMHLLKTDPFNAKFGGLPAISMLIRQPTAQ